MLSMFQTSVREQKILIQQLEQQPMQSESLKSIPPPPLPVVTVMKKNNKPSLMKQPNTIHIPQQQQETTHRLTMVVEENQAIPMQLKQISMHVKKALTYLNENSPMIQQVKLALNRIHVICNTSRSTKSVTTTTTKSSEIVIKRPAMTSAPNKRVNVADIHREIQR